MKFVKVLGVLLTALLALAVPARLTTAAPPQPAVVENSNLTGSGSPKLPAVAAGNGRVHISWAVDGFANYAERPEESGAFSYETLGTNDGDSDYSNAAVAVGSDGTVHFAWIEAQSTIRHRSKPAGGGWSGVHTAATGQPFANKLNIAVSGSTVFVAWRDATGNLTFARSADGGVSWPQVSGVADAAVGNARPGLATGPNGAVYLGFANPGGSVFIGQWNGNSFAVSELARGSKETFFADATVSVAPNGQVFLAWRCVGCGIYYAARQPDGAWGISRQFNLEAAGPVAIRIDSNSNIHMAWASGAIYYAIKTPAENFSSPVRVTGEGGFRTNLDLAISVRSGYTIAHLVHESFAGGQFIGYSRVQTSLSGPGATPTPTPTPTPQPNAPETGVFDFGSDAFRNLWTRTDSLVRQNAVNYSWIWGPNPFTQGFGEYYVQSPGQNRLVQYFDKSRMEINQPDAPRGPFYVTNGRLADELITGSLQTGDAQYEQRNPAAIAVAGDPQNTFPLYQDLRTVYRRQRPGDHANEEIFRALDGSVQIKPLPSANDDPAMLITQRVGGIGIPRVFWDYMNRPGRAVENGRTVTAAPLFDWRYVIGEPLTEAYWTYIRVNGRDQGVLVQAFERRVLTYTPANPGEFQVEMGNIGRHYFEWRYGVRPR